MKYILPFGNKNLGLDLSDSLGICSLSPQKQDPLSPFDAAFFEALERPINALPLKKRVSQRDRILLLCEDATRPTPTDVILTSLLKYFQEMGIQKNQIKILMAYGLHKPMNREALNRKLGKEVVGNYTILNHDASNEKNLFLKGNTTSGLPVYLNTAIQEADLIIGIGTISLSKEAGYSGGAKIVMPGIAGAETIHLSHAKVAQYPNQVGKIKDNPIRQDIEESGKMARLDYIINTVLNENNEICHVFFGHPKATFTEGIKAFDKIYRLEIPKPFDLLVVSSSPMDMDFYQASKAIAASSLGLRDGGGIILVSPCYDGISLFPYFDDMIMNGKDFNEWQNFILSSCELEYKVAAEICLGLRYVLDVRKIVIGMVTPGIPKEKITKMGMAPFASVQAALAYMSRRLGPGLRIGMVPKGPLTLLIGSDRSFS